MIKIPKEELHISDSSSSSNDLDLHINKEKSIGIVDHPLYELTLGIQKLFFSAFIYRTSLQRFLFTHWNKYSDTELLKFVCTKLVAEHSYEFIYVVANALALT